MNKLIKLSGLAATPMDKRWNHKQKIDYENDTEEEIKQKEFENRITVDKKPYFMCYIYPQLQQDYKQYVKKNNIKCLRYTGKTLNQIFDTPAEERTDMEKKMLYNYNKFMPLMKNDCIMNYLCYHIEDLDFDLKYFKQKENFDWTILLDKTHTVNKRSMLYQRVKDILEKYKNSQAEIAYSVNTLNDVFNSSKELDEYIKEMKDVNQMFFLERDIEHIGLSKDEIYNYFVDLIYTKYKQCYHILWNIFSEQIFKAINVGKMAVPVKDDNGTYYYFGEAYSFKIMDIDFERDKEE